MQDNPNTYSYGNSLIYTSRKNFFDPTRTQTGAPLPDSARRIAPIVNKGTVEPCTIQGNNCPLQDGTLRE